MIKINSVIGYWEHYTSILHQALTSIDRRALQVAFDTLFHAYHQGNKVFICGNGGSAADAQHLAAEFLIRLKPDINREPIPAIALAQDTSTITACGNDYKFQDHFARILYALGDKNDVLIVISTSGNSKNIINVLRQAKKKNFFYWFFR